MRFEDILRMAMRDKNLKFRSKKCKAFEQTWDTIVFWGLLRGARTLKEYRDADDWEVEEDTPRSGAV